MRISCECIRLLQESWKLACLFVASRLHYAISVLYGILAKNIHRLQRMQNTLARVVLGSSAPKFSHSTDMLCHLHWLPVQYRIQFKLALLASTLAATTHHCICRVYFITMYLVAVYDPVSLTCYLCRRINLILAHVVSALLRLHGTHFLQTFVHVHFMALLLVSWKPSILIMLFSMLLGP